MLFGNKGARDARPHVLLYGRTTRAHVEALVGSADGAGVRITMQRLLFGADGLVEPGKFSAAILEAPHAGIIAANVKMGRAVFVIEHDGDVQHAAKLVEYDAEGGIPRTEYTLAELAAGAFWNALRDALELNTPERAPSLQAAATIGGVEVFDPTAKLAAPVQVADGAGAVAGGGTGSAKASGKGKGAAAATAATAAAAGAADGGDAGAGTTDTPQGGAS